ncbi:LysM peptidoglycan-binding domain-containing protein [Bacillus alveayuensis]|jgi:LysM repeat protein|uniref:LysM repeat protein n=1 Tax=Aeribacillus alveayuensis TaxID=279215 RepID=A0ABT9VKL5_9BACI|nr:LysM peptidoglycan-binding domain-containing protein [Bacillus alveayuensis]MDQ0161502.1 LysM repeat protein [Bacillus alveayuensis]
MTNKRGYDQAESLRKQLIDEYKETTGTYPPRSEVHHKKGKRKSKNGKYPLLRFLVVTFIFIPLIVFSIIYLLERKNEAKVSEGSSDFESVIVSFSDYEKEVDQAKNANHNENESVAGKKEEKKDQQQEELKKDTAPIIEKNEENEKVEIEKKEEEYKSSNPSIDTNDQANENVRIITHTVQPGETLYRISMKYYQSRDGEEKIRQYNHLNGNEIYVGQVLKIPLE